MNKLSLLQTEKVCFFCQTPLNLHYHHIFGGRNRKIADQDGCGVYLCFDHHTGDHGVHTHPEIDKVLKAKCQIAWMVRYDKSVEDFIERYGKSYL